MSSSICDDNLVDVEDHLELFFLRRLVLDCDGAEPPKRRANSTDLKTSHPVLDCIPLLLCDLKCLNPANCTQPRSSACYVFDDAISFRSFVVHARIVGRLCGNKTFHKYIIDDGTATVEITVLRKQKVMQEMYNLRGEIDSFAAHSHAQNTTEMALCLRRLLNKAMEQVDASEIALGSKVLICGRPNGYRGNISIDAFCVWCYPCKRRDMEIAFKDFLIDWYSNKYPALVSAKTT